MLEKAALLEEILITIINDEIAAVKVAVESSRTLQYSSSRLSYFPASKRINARIDWITFK